MRRMLVGLVFAAALVSTAGCVIGCVGVGRDRSDGPKVSGTSTPEKTFEIVRDAMLANDLQAAFEQYSERKQKMEGGYEGFRKNFEANREAWRVLFIGSRVTFVAVDREQATAVILWGNGERHPPVSFILENGYWKIDQ